MPDLAPPLHKGEFHIGCPKITLPLWFAESAGHDLQKGTHSSLHNPWLIRPRGQPQLGHLLHLSSCILKHLSHKAKVKDIALSPLAPTQPYLGGGGGPVVTPDYSALLTRPAAAQPLRKSLFREPRKVIQGNGRIFQLGKRLYILDVLKKKK